MDAFAREFAQGYDVKLLEVEIGRLWPGAWHVYARILHARVMKRRARWDARCAARTAHAIRNETICRQKDMKKPKWNPVLGETGSVGTFMTEMDVDGLLQCARLAR